MCVVVGITVRASSRFCTVAINPLFSQVPPPSLSQVDYLGKQSVSSQEAQDHGCTDNAVQMLWENARDSPLAKHVSIKVGYLSVLI